MWDGLVSRSLRILHHMQMLPAVLRSLRSVSTRAGLRGPSLLRSGAAPASSRPSSGHGAAFSSLPPSPSSGHSDGTRAPLSSHDLRSPSMEVEKDIATVSPHRCIARRPNL